MDSTSIPAPVPDVVGAARLGANGDLSGVRLGVVREFAGEGAEPGVAAVYHEAVDALVKLGAEVVEVSCPSFTYALPAYYLIAPSECSSNLARFDGVRYGLRVGDDGNHSLEEVMSLTRDAGFGPEVKRRIILGTYALSAGYYDAYYGQAQKVRTVLIREHAAAFEQFDLLVTPTSPTVAFELGAKTHDPIAMYLNDLLTIPSCMAGLPGLNIPCGLSDGLPVGLQLIGPQFSENRLFEVAQALETAIAFDAVPERYR
jgi:aspartyl-tRNA(Asn)/glutamyl-tRNA(Gln) amidotransferase subunit A